MTIQAKDLAEIFLTGDDEKALEIVLGYLENHSHDELYHDLLTPAMYLIGDWWQETVFQWPMNIWRLLFVILSFPQLN